MKCESCGVHTITQPCERCARLQAIGVLVISAHRSNGYYRGDLDVLDAIAFLLIERAKMVRDFRRALFDEQRAAQREVREAVSEAQYDMRRAIGE